MIKLFMCFFISSTKDIIPDCGFRVKGEGFIFVEKF